MITERKEQAVRRFKEMLKINTPAPEAAAALHREFPDIQGDDKDIVHDEALAQLLAELDEEEACQQS